MVGALSRTTAMGIGAIRADISNPTVHQGFRFQVRDVRVWARAYVCVGERCPIADRFIAFEKYTLRRRKSALLEL
jgi:hypothetical protein|tara:strand:- start:82569 stop:82793 length:225 start_codon:yes stop_codon:yes gene_type:complete